MPEILSIAEAKLGTDIMSLFVSSCNKSLLKLFGFTDSKPKP